MKKLIMMLVVVAACHSSRPEPVRNAPVILGSQTGAPDPSSAVRAFLAAAKQQDLQAMGALFGDAQGSARDRIPRDELEKREIIMATCLRHDHYDIVADAPGMAGAHTLAVNLVRGTMSRSLNFDVVQTLERRWFVRSFELEKIQDFCGRR